ncbi:MAG: DUF4178 domain-containing protein [Desulfobacterales bacterium]|nr:DUF4178 domain-containing protein [Desulfobacterales bacterium]
MLDPATSKSFEERFDAIRSLKTEDIVSEKEKNTLTIMDIKENAFFVFNKKTYFVKQVCPYQEASEDFTKKLDYTITELNCLCLETGDNVNFEWEYDDELEVGYTLERLTFKGLTDEEGKPVDADDLDQIVDDSDLIMFDKEKFWYEDDWPALYICKGKEESVYMYEFENKSHTKFITIEEWGTDKQKQEYQIFLSMPANPKDITILSRG